MAPKPKNPRVALNLNKAAVKQGGGAPLTPTGKGSLTPTKGRTSSTPRKSPDKLVTPRKSPDKSPGKRQSVGAATSSSAAAPAGATGSALLGLSGAAESLTSVTTYMERSPTDRLGGPAEHDVLDAAGEGLGDLAQATGAEGVKRDAKRSRRGARGSGGPGAAAAAAIGDEPAASAGGAAKATAPSRQLKFKVAGEGLEKATCREEALFAIEATDESGEAVNLRSEPVSVVVRGVQKTRSKTTYSSDGTVLHVAWQPRQSGKYEVCTAACSVLRAAVRCRALLCAAVRCCALLVCC